MAEANGRSARNVERSRAGRLPGPWEGPGPGREIRPRTAQTVSTWLRASRLGLVIMALLAGVGAGFGAVGFRWLIFAFTWLATGHNSFGQMGRVDSAHLAYAYLS